MKQVNEGMRHKENTERLEWLQIHVDCAKTPELTLDEKLTFNSTTNLVGPRKFLHHGLIKKAKSSKEIGTQQLTKIHVGSYQTLLGFQWPFFSMTFCC